MGYADELAKTTKTKQQIKDEAEALRVKCRNAFYQVFPELVEHDAVRIMSECYESSKRGEHSYICLNLGPSFPEYSSTLDARHVFQEGKYFYYTTKDYQVFKDAKKHYQDNKRNCNSEFRAALVTRLEREGFKVKLDKNTLLSFLANGSLDDEVRIKIRW